MPYKYENGKWTWIPESESSLPSTSTNEKPSTDSNIKPPSELTDINDGATTDTGSDATDEYLEYEYNLVEGDATVEPDPKLKAKKNIKFSGLGTQLSGNYYVENVTHSYSTGGYTQTLNVSRDGFGDFLKKGR